MRGTRRGPAAGLVCCLVVAFVAASCGQGGSIGTEESTQATTGDEGGAVTTEATPVTTSGAETTGQSATIGPSGGTVTEGGVSVIVPEGAVTGEVAITIQETAVPDVPAEGGITAAGRAFDIVVSDELHDGQPVEVVLPLDGPLAMDSGHYTVYRWDGAQWHDMGGEVDGNTIRTWVSDFSIMLPILSEDTYRPHRFICSNTRVFTRVFLYRYVPARGWDQGAPQGINPGMWLATCKPHEDGRRWLPTGSYAYCVDYWHQNTGWECYIREHTEGVSENDPTETLIATADILLDITLDHPGRCDENMMECWGSQAVTMPPGIGPWVPPDDDGDGGGGSGGSAAPPSGIVATPASGIVEAAGGFPIGAAYDSSTVELFIDPDAVEWIALSEAAELVDKGTGARAADGPDGTPDVLRAFVDDYLIVQVSKDGVTSEPIVLEENDAMGTALGNQAIIYGYHPSVWYNASVDWGADPPAGIYATGPETGELTEFFDENGPGTYTFELTFVNVHTDRAGHPVVYLLVAWS
jgi:hypothetical protein